MTFSEQVWQENQDIIEKIMNMDFIQELYTGTLSDEQFFYYIEQDIHYLNDYARAMSFLAAKSENTEQLKFFLKITQSTFEEQVRVHQEYTTLAHYKETYLLTPAYRNYTHFNLHNASTKPIAIGYASLLPCPWLYVHIGEIFLQKTFVNAKYQYWFAANCAKEVQDSLKEQIKAFDVLAEQYPCYKEEMRKVFRTGLFLEYTFWEDAYNLQCEKV